MAEERSAPAWGTVFVAGIGAGLVAALASVAVGLLLRAQVPPWESAAWSAFLAGIFGGLLYGWLTRIVPRPEFALWVITLALATVDSILIIALPFPNGRGPQMRIPAYGLLTPIRQVAALVGVGSLSQQHFPREGLVAVTAMHYVTAVAAALFVPWWASRRRPR